MALWKWLWIQNPSWLLITKFDVVDIPISCTNTTDIDYIEQSNSNSLYDVAKCFTMPCKNISHPKFLKNMNFINSAYVSKDCCQLFSPYFIHKHTHPFGQFYEQLGILSNLITTQNFSSQSDYLTLHTMNEIWTMLKCSASWFDLVNGTT